MESSTNYGDDRVLIRGEYQGGDRVPKRWLSTKALTEYQGDGGVTRLWRSTKALAEYQGDGGVQGTSVGVRQWRSGSELKSPTTF